LGETTPFWAKIKWLQIIKMENKTRFFMGIEVYFNEVR
jgi:hypothetical protein